MTPFGRDIYPIYFLNFWKTVKLKKIWFWDGGTRAASFGSATVSEHQPAHPKSCFAHTVHDVGFPKTTGNVALQ